MVGTVDLATASATASVEALLEADCVDVFEDDFETFLDLAIL
tara:strand:+ start:321 stop:446 length:126 start_codon:yes stop_codon:yes gene_type:complete